MLSSSFITNVSYSSDIPTNTIHLWGDTEWEGKDPETNIQFFYYMVGFDFVNMMDIEIIEGRNFELSTDSSNYIINETAVKAMGIENTVGKWIQRGEDRRGKIIGVVKNFHFKSLKDGVGPMMIISRRYYNYILIKIAEGRFNEAVELIKEKWRSFESDYPADIHVLESELDSLYGSEYRLGKLFTIFSILAVFISCMGLFGLATYLGELRQKEIGIRKILGAKLTTIIGVLLKEYLVLLLIAEFLGGVIGYIIMNDWLQNFAYRIRFSLVLFLYSFIILCLITIGTVLYQIIKLSITKPIDTLKYE
jgi:putative ABC transport system permease protein